MLCFGPSKREDMTKMRLHRCVSVSVAAILVAALLPISGCRAGSSIRSTWPVAASERVVPRPPAPVRWPLTGLDAGSAEEIRTRIVSMKVENSPEARPQSALDQADVVYETITEGGVTRFNALFHSQAPTVAGPVRSARWSDTYIVPQFQALFSHCGGKTPLMKELKDKKYSDMDQFFNESDYFRSSDRKAPHNLYGDITKIRASAISKRGYVAEATVRSFAFDRSGKVTTPTVTSIVVPFDPGNRVGWAYDPGTKLYSRTINGTAHKDGVSGQQYTARNVVVLWALSKPRGADVKGSTVIEIVLNGTGRASVFRDGQRYDGRWETQGDTPPVFTTGEGAAIKLSPGVTWFQVIETNQDITAQ